MTLHVVVSVAPFPSIPGRVGSEVAVVLTVSGVLSFGLAHTLRQRGPMPAQPSDPTSNDVGATRVQNKSWSSTIAIGGGLRCPR